MVGVAMAAPNDAEQLIKVLTPIRFHPRLPAPLGPSPQAVVLKLRSTDLRGVPGPLQGVGEINTISTMTLRRNRPPAL